MQYQSNRSIGIRMKSLFHDSEPEWGKNNYEGIHIYSHFHTLSFKDSMKMEKMSRSKGVVLNKNSPSKMISILIVGDEKDPRKEGKKRKR